MIYAHFGTNMRWLRFANALVVVVSYGPREACAVRLIACTGQSRLDTRIGRKTTNDEDDRSCFLKWLTFHKTTSPFLGPKSVQS